jgi:hypothetical protein
MFTTTYSSEATPDVNPGHPLIPPPNGMNSKFWPLKSTGLSSNLFERNSSGLSHTAGSLWIAHVLTNIFFFTEYHTIPDSKESSSNETLLVEAMVYQLKGSFGFAILKIAILKCVI